jgi:hypothetical protein
VGPRAAAQPALIAKAFSLVVVLGTQYTLNSLMTFARPVNADAAGGLSESVS